MRFSLVSTLAVAVSAVWAQNVDSYIATEGPIAKAGLLANIGPSGSKSSGAKSGVVIASPSTTDPDYLFTWMRDASLVFEWIVNAYTTGRDTTLRSQIDNFVNSQARIQQVSNPSGSITTGGLGEPKFNVDETAFTGPWGRPQRDGPALRANTLITWANHLISTGNTTYVTNTLWPIIKRDLDYVSGSWTQATFDLWEEVNSASFFTTAVQHKSLRLGIRLANAIGQTGVVSGYTTQANSLLCFLQSYWSTSGYIISNTGGGRSGKDSNSVLASIHTFDAAAGCDAATFQPCSDRALANLKIYVDSFRSIYSINSGIASNAAIATGRYPEDVYFGGNPWYLTTLAVTEQLYDALTVWKARGSLSVTSVSLPFFRTFSSSVAVGTYASTTSTFTSLTTSIKTYADGFVAVVAKYTPSNGGLAEQINKNNGSPLSAVDLTWSYASALSAFDARTGFTPASWGAAGLTACATVTITFNVQATTVFGENIFLTGSIPALQNWSPDNAWALSAANYPTWSVTVTVPASTSFQYKFIRKFNGAVTWESDPNRSFTSPASGSTTLNDVWR